ncbi:nucleotidyltransferase family protein [Bowmanella denitrificans]|uniref:Nucleotidyltransferase family protein n=1 Tax=Bowmanella denitrificans TaxID=366582 RepID=A0ABN0XPZ3_9ALTE
MPKPSLLSQCICQPPMVQQFCLTDWDILIQQAYSAGVLARLQWLFERDALEEHIPEGCRWHFQSASRFAQMHKKNVLREVSLIREALHMTGIQPVFLKGAAYLVCDDDCHQGRVFSDVDIFVPKASLPKVEQVLGWHGWEFAEKDDYDEKYYRQWMHEIPPLIHIERGTALDVHHNLLPLIGRIKLNAGLLHKNVQTANNGFNTLAAQDRILHSAAHLLLNGEFEHGFRDISDIYLLIVQHSQLSSTFLPSLVERAQQLGLERILLYCLDVLEAIFSLEVSNPLYTQLTSGKSAPSPFVRGLLRFMHYRALQPHHPSCRLVGQRVALFGLFLRSHWMKMPVTILVMHLIRKMWVKPLLDWYKNRHQAGA